MNNFKKTHLTTYISLCQTFIIALVACITCGKAYSYGMEVVSGRVTDQHNKPVRSAKVDLWERDGEIFKTAKTNRHGEFKIKHIRCGPCSLEVVAPPKTRLSQAFVEDVPGNEDRSVLVSLRRGFLLEGRIVHNGKGLKDLVVKVYSTEHHKEDKERIYGGGATTTGFRGGFKMVLTPGNKRLVVVNKKYPELARKHQSELTITKDTKIENVELPSR